MYVLLMLLGNISITDILSLEVSRSVLERPFCPLFLTLVLRSFLALDLPKQLVNMYKVLHFSIKRNKFRLTNDLIKRYSVFTHGLLEKQVFSFIILVFILVLD